MQILQQHTASREKRPNVITFSGEVKANLKLLRNSVPLHTLFQNLREFSSQCLVESLLDLARGAEYLQYGRLTLAPTMEKFGTRHTEDSNNFLKRFVTRTHQIVSFLSWIVCQYAAKTRSKIEQGKLLSVICQQVLLSMWSFPEQLANAQKNQLYTEPVKVSKLKSYKVTSSADELSWLGARG